MGFITFESFPNGADLEIEGEPCGQTPVGIEMTSELIALHEACITGGSISCEWEVFEPWLLDGTVGRVWWDLTDDERYTIADYAVRNWTRIIKYPQIPSVRPGASDCLGGTGEWKIAQCIQNAIIRYIQFSECRGSLSSCYYNSELIGCNEHCYCDSNYHLPAYLVMCVTPVGADPGFAHASAAIQIKPDSSKLESYYLFQYNDYNIQPGGFHVPTNSYDKLYLRIVDPIANIVCAGFTLESRAVWYYVNGEIT